MIAQFNVFSDGLNSTAAAPTPPLASAEAKRHHVQVVNKVPKAFLEVIRTQFDLLQSWLKPIADATHTNTEETRALRHAIHEVTTRYEKLIQKIQGGA